MFDESRANEACFPNLSSPSIVVLPDLPDLYETCSLQQQDSLLRTSAEADCDSRMPSCGEASGVLRPSQEDETSEAGGGLVLDNTDNLEALMGYTDEHDSPVEDVNKSLHELKSRRKRQCEEVEDEDEVDSGQLSHKRQKSQETHVIHGPSSPDASINGTISAVTQPPCDEKFGDEFCVDQSTDELQMLCDEFGFEMSDQECSSCSPDGGGDSISSGSARQSMRQRMRETVKLLRKAIPGGECMDTAIVLDETINYVKLLQLQVQALGAQRLAQRSSR